jgi:phage-related protein
MGEYTKAWVALIMAILVIIEQIWGWSSEFINEAWITGLLAILTPLFVFLFPNRPS